jgi:hypothetical protein
MKRTPTITKHKLKNNNYTTINLTLTQDDAIQGSAFMGGAKDDSGGSSNFELRRKKDRYQGVGSRTYPSKGEGGQPIRCTLNYDALLKPLS